MIKLVLLSVALVACSGSAVVVNQQTANAVTSKEMNTANAVASYAQSTTPPANAQSMGMKSNPQAGPTTIPITNVEVFVFTANVDGQGGDETLYWAATDTMVYVWGQIDLYCVDDNGNATGETGTADFVYSADSQGGYGWMAATDSCGYSTYFGCSADPGGAESCGGCDWNQDFIACVAISN